MRKWLGLLICLVVLAGCGGSSGLSESEIDKLVETTIPAGQPTCVKTKNGDDRDFTCNALSGKNEVTIEVIIGEDGESVVVTNCEAKEALLPDLTHPCEGLGG